MVDRTISSSALPFSVEFDFTHSAVGDLLQAANPAASPLLTTAAAPSTDLKDVSLVLKLGSAGGAPAELPLLCTQEAVLGLVVSSYLIGGFERVIEARNAVDESVRSLRRTAADMGSELQWLRDHGANWRGDAAKALASSIERLQRARSDANTQVQSAEAAILTYDEYFRRAWNAVAVCEDTFLRTYDAEVLTSFKALAQQNRDRAAQEWARYVFVDDAGKALNDFATVKLESVAGLRFTDDALARLAPIDDAPKKQGKAAGAPETREQRVVRARRALANRALDLRMLAERVRAARQIKQEREQAPQTAAQKKATADNFRDAIVAWQTQREHVATEFPTLLQVYPRLRNVADTNALSSNLHEELATALLRIRDVSARIIAGAKSLYGTAQQLRAVPIEVAIPQTSAKPTTTPRYRLADADLDRVIRIESAKGASDKDRIKKLRFLLQPHHRKAAEQYGFTIPASEVVALILESDPDAKEDTGWQHAPVVNFHLQARAKNDLKLASFYSPTTLQTAATHHVLDRAARLREQSQQRTNNGMLLMWGGAALLAPFTAGGSLYVAGLVQASFAFGEIVTAVADYWHAGDLSSLSLSAIEAAGWTRPSTVRLVKLIAGNLTDAAMNVIPAEKIPALVHQLYLASAFVGVAEKPQP